jgi:hypothetical protein
VLPRTHHLFIEEAAQRSGEFGVRDVDALLSGNDDEDVLIVPFAELRLRAAGLTHTYRPGKRFGELGFPSAKRQCVRFVEAALRAEDPARAAHFVGRGCHVLGDAAVPARANGVWHIEGDPLEAYIEARISHWRGATVPDVPVSPPGELVERLAVVAAGFSADTTRTPWGRAAFRWFGVGRELGEEELARQADALVPMAIACTASLLQWVEREIRSIRV